MKTQKPRSLQARVLALVLGAAGALWVAVGAFTWIDTRHELDELLDAHLAQSAALLMARQLPELEDHEGIDAPVLHRYAPRVAFQVFHEGRLALRSVNAPTAPMMDPAQAAANEFRSARIGQHTWRVFATRGSQSDVLVLVAEQSDARNSILAAILRTTLGPLLMGMPLLALALWWSVRRGLRPMMEIGQALARRAADDFTPIERRDAPSEMKPMLDALDSLFERVSTLLAGERRFTADAAHELRTPLSAIRAQAQVALAETDPDLRRRALAATIEGCDRASRLTGQLLALARLDAQAGGANEAVELHSLVRQVLAEMADRALAKSQDLRFEQADGPAVVHGDRVLLAALVRNLADNAIRYAPPSAAIEVRLHGTAGHVVLTVENSGNAPGAQDMARLGERFHRALGSGEAGSGLGLSIVRRIAQLHGAGLGFSRSSRLGGLRVEVSFPSATQAGTGAGLSAPR